jgi:L-amino acid N-acyltransferase YncA
MTGEGEDDRARVVSGGKSLDGTGIAEMREVIGKALPGYLHDQYRHYPSRKENGWVAHALARLDLSLADPENLLFHEAGNLLACRISRWDAEHFGFGMAMVSLPLTQEGGRQTVDKLLGECLAALRKRGVRFISARIAGDDATAIHAFEQRGFRYLETVIWPVLPLEGKETIRPPDVRPMVEGDLERVLDIAGNHQFKRSHHHVDSRFDPRKVDEMHAKWARTSWHNREPVAIIESEGKIAGYFAFKIDKNLSEALGLRYARMRSLTLDPAFRGRGMGKRLFGGTIAMMREMGAEVVDSGYASKNHQSARLHVQHAFESVYEEVTLHMWLEGAR